MRTIKINLKMCFLIVVAIIFGGIFSITAYASEDTGKKNLSEETKSKIERIKEEYPDCRNYIDSVILFYEEHSDMSEDINQNIIEAIEGITATFSKKANGYYVYFYVTDVYDFAWNRYDNFAVDFANNYCYAMQSAGYIKPFNIAISYAA